MLSLKKILSIFLATVLLLGLSACGEKTTAQESETYGSAVGGKNTEVSSDKYQSATPETLSGSGFTDSTLYSPSAEKRKRQISDQVKNYIEANSELKLESITVFEDRDNATAATTGAYKVYCTVTCSAPGDSVSARNTVSNYSNTISTTVNAYLEDVTTLSFSWLANCINGSAKLSYKKIDGMLSLDMAQFDKKFAAETDIVQNEVQQ